MAGGTVVFGVGALLRAKAQLRIARLMFEARPDDVYVATFPKSGTTLMQMIVYQLRTDGRMDFAHLNAVFPWIEMEIQRNRLKHLNQLPSPRNFKTHLAASHLPIETGKYIYVVRDLRDVIVSAYHHNRLLGGIEQTLEQMTQRFLRGSSGNPLQSSWFEHVESWWALRDRPNVLFLSYEGMLADLEGTVRQVARFLEIPVREEDMPRILEQCSFESMKRNEAKFDPRLQWAVADTPGFIRQGKAGSGRELAPGHLEALERKLSALAQKLGCGGGDPYREIVEAAARAAGQKSGHAILPG
jgi:hypothetical protein